MLKEVCSAIACICFRATSGINPYTNRRCLGPWRVLSCYLKILSAQGLFRHDIRLYREAIGQGSGLCLGGSVVDGRGEVAPFSQRIESSTGAKPLLETESYPTRSHGSRGEAEAMGGEVGGWWFR
jgi:hypothetical protein